MRKFIIGIIVILSMMFTGCVLEDDDKAMDVFNSYEDWYKANKYRVFHYSDLILPDHSYVTVYNFDFEVKNYETYTWELLSVDGAQNMEQNLFKLYNFNIEDHGWVRYHRIIPKEQDITQKVYNAQVALKIISDKTPPEGKNIILSFKITP